MYPMGSEEYYNIRPWIGGDWNGIYLGRFKNEIDAFIAYKQFKENYIKQVADEYKKLIPTKLYEALYKYEVKIND